MTTTQTTATPIKLNNGQWGARIRGLVSEGQTILVKTRGGKSWEATVARIVSVNDTHTVTICETSRSTTSRAGIRQHRLNSGTCRVSGCSQPATVNGMCARCDFDEE